MAGKRAKSSGLRIQRRWDLQEHATMKLFTGCLAASLVLFAAGAQAQRLAPYTPVSDFGGPYAAMPDAPGAPYGSGPRLLPPEEVYTGGRGNRFSPLGIPRQHGFVYAIEVIDRSGESGRLIVDARNGRIIRFRPGYRTGNNFNEEPAVVYGQGGQLPPSTPVRGEPRPPRATPRVSATKGPAEGAGAGVAPSSLVVPAFVRRDDGCKKKRPGFPGRFRFGQY